MASEIGRTSRRSGRSPREREITERVVVGQLNNQIAADLGPGEQNIKLHRVHVMEGMGVQSLADLVRAGRAIGRGEISSQRSVIGNQ